MSRRDTLRKPAPDLFDPELADLPPDARWREWMGRVEAAIFASPDPVPRARLAALVGTACVLDDLIADIRDELKGRPYDLVAVEGGWQHRTRPRFSAAIRQARGEVLRPPALSQTETLILTAIAYLQPVTRAQLSASLGREISRDTMALLKRHGLIAAGPRVAQLGAPLTYVTMPAFLSLFGLGSLRDLPDIENLGVGPTLGRDGDRAADDGIPLGLGEGMEADADDEP